MSQTPIIPPTVDSVFAAYESYKQKEQVTLNSLAEMIKTFPLHTNPIHVNLKIATINSLWSTNIKYPAQLREKILNQIDLTTRIECGDLTVVEDIAYVQFQDNENKQKTIRYYSFATKYCHWHAAVLNRQPNHYPIFDSFVELALQKYNQQEKFASFSSMDLRNYGVFTEVIAKFCSHFELSHIPYNMIDAFLWSYGKEHSNNLTEGGREHTQNIPG